MSETNELFSSVNHIKNKVDTLERIELLRLKSDTNLQNKFKNMFVSDNDLLSVYKAIDGVRTQTQIASLLSLKEMQVTRKIKRLESEGLIELVSAVGARNKVYSHTVVEKAYRFCEKS